jgi:hypothetical protein
MLCHVETVNKPGNMQGNTDVQVKEGKQRTKSAQLICPPGSPVQVCEPGGPSTRCLEEAA